MKTIGFGLLFCIASASAFAQGTLQFNQVILLNDQSGVQTVPNGKVWKITFVNTTAGRRITTFSSWGSESWTASKPNPCTGATSGSSSGLSYVNYSACPTGGNALYVNGQAVSFGSGNPLWMPAGTVVNITGTPCYNTASGSVGSVPYYNNSDNIWECGPFNVSFSTVNNSPVASIIEFNVIP